MWVANGKTGGNAIGMCLALHDKQWTPDGRSARLTTLREMNMKSHLSVVWMGKKSSSLFFLFLVESRFFIISFHSAYWKMCRRADFVSIFFYRFFCIPYNKAMSSHNKLWRIRITCNEPSTEWQAASVLGTLLLLLVLFGEWTPEGKRERDRKEIT